jgi:nucleotide-binding universal stress UspA family protein
LSIKKVLVPTDFSDHARRAFELAHELAAQLGAKLCLLHVQSGSALRTAVQEGLLDGAATDEQIQLAVEQLTECRFSELIAGLGSSRVAIEHACRRGEPVGFGIFDPKS